MFYEAQRSGKLPETNRITWRGDSALGDKGGNTDLTGGWYDAGDYIKFTLPMSSAVTYLLWGLLRWPDAYVAAGQLDYVYDSVKWPLDYFLKCWDPTQMEFYAQVGKVSLDHDYWGRSEDMDMERPAYKVSRSGPGSDVAGQTATALAMGYLAFKERNMTYATTLLDAAKGLYDFAKNYRGFYSDTITDARDVYKSSMYEDELALAAVWLHKATGERTYLVDAETFVPMYTAWSLDWDGKIAAAQLALYEVTGKQTYRDQVEAFVTSYMPGGSVPYTPLGLAYRSQWGALRYAANVAMFALIAADDGINAAEYREWALSQIHYILGDNKYGMSYVIGYGDNYPLKPHHAGSSCPDRPASCTWNEFNSPAPNPQILYGALVGGPDQNDNYVDDRTDYVKNEVACDYNAGMQSAIAGIIHLRETNQLPEDAVTSTTSPPGQRSTLFPVTVTDSGPTTSTASPGSASSHNLSQVLEFSILFYEAQRSGDLPDTNRIPWRGDSALDDTVPGGWYDAGDHIKFTFPMSAAVTYLLLGVHAWKDAYVASSQLNNMYDSIRWPLDYFLNSWDPTKQELYVQVGKVSLDHAVWGRAEDMTMDRPAYKLSPSGPGSDAAAGTAAAMAIGAIVFQKEDPAYASRLLTAAAELYDFANTYTGIYTDTVTDSRDAYGSNDYNDELALAAVWLYKATRQQHYLTDARTHASKLSTSPWALDWSDKTAIVHLAMYEETQEEKYSDAIKTFMTSYLPGGSVAYTPCGLAWRLEWGPLRYTANVAMFALLAADAGFEPQTYRSWALGQIGYMLGENNAGRSYVVGYGSNYPVRPHHQNSACHPHPAVCDWSTFDDPAPNAHVLKGALVGGPGSKDNYVDDRTDYIQNEVACDYNSGFQSAIAGLLHLEITSQFPVSALNRCYP
ncbi:endoglucanase 4-like [Haliotis cracherodii]|uniref:endoglucanase 4-like n=1 Tax=Haliotis cracherodii TaxID=6455 RepID=UPI0039EB5255